MSDCDGRAQATISQMGISPVITGSDHSSSSALDMAAQKGQ
jgi:hypothetical protein